MAGDDADGLRRLVERLQDDVAGLRTGVGRAASGADLARLRDEVRLLERRVRATERLTGLRDDVRALGGRVAALEGRLAEQDRVADDRAARFAAELEQVLRRVGRLEDGQRAGPVRPSPRPRPAASPATDLDDADGDTRELAAVAARGATRAAALLTDEQRAALRADVADGERAAAERDRAVEDLVAASLVIARSEPGSPGRADAVGAFTAARAALAEHRRTHDEVTGAADGARHALAADQRREADHRAAVEAGRASHAELVRRARARLEGVAEAGGIPPPWLDDVLGVAPPAAERGPWLDAGAELLAYRWTYGVTGAPALGDPPDDGDPGRLGRYRALTEALRRG